MLKLLRVEGKSWLTEKSRWRRCDENAAQNMTSFSYNTAPLARVRTSTKERAFIGRSTLEKQAWIDLKKGALESARWSEWRRREIIQGWEMSNLPLSQPQQHNKVIKSDGFARYFGDDICPSLYMDPYSLSMCQSFHPSPCQVLKMKSIISLTCSTPWALDPVLLFSIWHEYEFHDVDYIPDYKTVVFFLPCQR